VLEYTFVYSSTASCTTAPLLPPEYLSVEYSIGLQKLIAQAAGYGRPQTLTKIDNEAVLQINPYINLLLITQPAESLLAHPA